METDWDADLRRPLAMLDERRHPASGKVIDLETERKKRAAGLFQSNRPQSSGVREGPRRKEE
jgi:hypothetical protein